MLTALRCCHMAVRMRNLSPSALQVAREEGNRTLPPPPMPTRLSTSKDSQKPDPRLISAIVSALGPELRLGRMARGLLVPGSQSPYRPYLLTRDSFASGIPRPSRSTSFAGMQMGNLLSGPLSTRRESRAWARSVPFVRAWCCQVWTPANLHSFALACQLLRPSLFVPLTAIATAMAVSC